MTICLASKGSERLSELIVLKNLLSPGLAVFLSRDRSAGEDLFIFYCYHHWLSPSSCVVKVKSKVSSQTENKTLLLSHISFFNRGVFTGPLKTRQFNSAGASKSGRVRGPGRSCTGYCVEGSTLGLTHKNSTHSTGRGEGMEQIPGHSV